MWFIKIKRSVLFRADIPLLGVGEPPDFQVLFPARGQLTTRRTPPAGHLAQCSSHTIEFALMARMFHVTHNVMMSHKVPSLWCSVHAHTLPDELQGTPPPQFKVTLVLFKLFVFSYANVSCPNLKLLFLDLQI